MKLLFSIFLLLPFSIFAQTIRGRISDKNNQPVAGAIIILMKADSTIIVNSVSDSNGLYILHFTGNAVFIKAEMMGFNSEIKKISNKSSIDFMLLEVMSKNMKEVTITAKKPLVEYKADRTIFNVENSIAATGGDAMDAIKHAPGIRITNNEISIAGKNSVAVMINGRLQQLSGDDLIQMLHSIPADNLSKIEIITSPSSKYDAEGNAGIVNLVLKKNLIKGFNGNTTLSNEYNMGLNFPSLSTSFYFKKEKLNLFFNANVGKQGHPFTSYTNSYYPDQHWHQDVKYPYNNSIGRFQFGGDYLLSKKSTIGFMVNEVFSWLNNDETITASGYGLNSDLDSIINTIGTTTDKYLGKLTTNLNYEFRFDSTGKKMNIDVDYYHQKGDKNRDFMIESTGHDHSYLNQSFNRASGKPLTEIISAKVDFETPLRKLKFNFGLKISDSKHDLNNLYETKIGKDYINEISKSSHFTYNEEIESAYVNVNSFYKKYEFNIGLRVEHTRALGMLINTNQTNVYDYTKLFPSGNLLYSLNKDHGFSLSFSSRISRPNYSFLNPYKFYYTPNSFITGNPNLQPSFNFITNFNYNYKSNLNVRLFYNNISNYFDRVYTIDTIHTISADSRINLGHKKIIASNISVSIDPTKWWELAVEISSGYVKFNPFANMNTTEYTGINWGTEVTNIFYLNKEATLSAELSGYYDSPRQRDYVSWVETSAISFGLKYMLLNKNLIITLNGNDIFASSFGLQTNKLNNTEEYTYDGHSYRISVLYKFGNNNIKAKQVKSLEEIQRVN